MSYIRSGSNPEGLYIWGDGTNVYFSASKEDSSQTNKYMPVGVWHELIRRYHRMFDFDTPISFKSAKLELWWDTKKPKLKLSYKGWSYVMYQVTFGYIAFANLENVNRMVRNKKNKIIAQ